MSPSFSISLLALIFAGFCTFETLTHQAGIPLITVKENNDNSEDKQFLLNPDAISMIKQLSSPVKIIAAIGDARVGKSTALNFIHRSLSDSDQDEDPKEIFRTGNSMQPVTHGVWISTVRIHGKDLILLDVEGTDLGDDSVTDKLSIFTALTSSTLMLFMKESPSTHMLDFLYKIVRLSELAFGKKQSAYFPRLVAVLRGALEPPEEYKNIDQYIIDALITPKWKDNSDNKRKAIETRFPRQHIEVFNLPYISNPKLLQTLEYFSNQEYLSSIKTLTEKILQLPEKKSLEGTLMDGEALAALAEELVEVMNDTKLWENLNPDFYQLFEENSCKRNYEKYIKPLLDVVRNTVLHIKLQKEEKMNFFKLHCSLPEWISRANNEIENAIKFREFTEKEENIAYDTIKTAFKWVGHCYATATVLRGIGALFFSDGRLKQNIVLVNNSEYEMIGLRGVEWVWNKEAERLGLSGRGSGVVAQDVELLYPWAVTEGYDGYKRVNYFALRLLILKKTFRQKTS